MQRREEEAPPAWMYVAFCVAVVVYVALAVWVGTTTHEERSALEAACKWRGGVLVQDRCFRVGSEIRL